MLNEREKTLLFELSALKKKLKDAEKRYNDQLTSIKLVPGEHLTQIYLEYAAEIVGEINTIMTELEIMHEL